MLDGERRQPVVVTDQLVAGTQLHELDGVRETSEDPPQRAEEVAQPRRAVDRDRHLAAAERKRLQHPGQPEVVIGVVVGQEDLAQLDQPDVDAQELPLRALRAVEEEPLAAAAQEQRRRCALRGRHRAGGAEEDEIEVQRGVVNRSLAGTDLGQRQSAGPGLIVVPARWFRPWSFHTPSRGSPA